MKKKIDARIEKRRGEKRESKMGKWTPPYFDRVCGGKGLPTRYGGRRGEIGRNDARGARFFYSISRL